MNHVGVRFGEELESRSFAFVDFPTFDFCGFFRDWNAFFESSAKFDYGVPPGELSGYHPFRSERAVSASVSDPKEFFHYFRGGNCPPQLRAVADVLFDACSALALQVAERLDVHSNDEVSLRAMVANSSSLLLRVIRYLPMADLENFAETHTDIDLFTVIPAIKGRKLVVEQANSPGVIIENIEGAAVILAGEMLESKTMGRIKAAKHRVLGAAEQTMSVVFFVNPSPEVIVGGVSAGEMVAQRLAEMKSRF
ncbi:hypothetical protein ACQR10_03625 [Bradyrhizobium sp. HKCCYLRH2060]|uniref:hypothetical protein n=1 Tax=Bradyrhizobium TaxID=374 RepID=UPI002916252D|nr:hypothetical protein [Bradyrhizobium sp. SZCCHNR3003]